MYFDIKPLLDLGAIIGSLCLPYDSEHDLFVFDLWRVKIIGAREAEIAQYFEYDFLRKRDTPINRQPAIYPSFLFGKGALHTSLFDFTTQKLIGRLFFVACEDDDDWKCYEKYFIKTT